MVSMMKDESSLSNSSDSDQWCKRDRWRTRKFGIKREDYVLDIGFSAITDAEYDNMPDPTVELRLLELKMMLFTI